MDYRPFWLSLQFMAFIVHLVLPRKRLISSLFLIMLMSSVFGIES